MFLPKNFPFFQVEEQQKIIQLLEKGKPLAIITATTRNPEMAGALYPFPVFEDGDFDIPSVFITEDQGNELAKHVGNQITLEIQAERIPARGSNVVARKGKDQSRRIVFFAHIDAKLGTPTVPWRTAQELGRCSCVPSCSRITKEETALKLSP